MVVDEPLLQQFARFPVPGAVKTRLQTGMSAEQACRVHCELVELTARNLLASQLGPVQLWLDRGGSHPLIETCLSLGQQGPLLQRGRNLGERMHYALQSGLARHATVILVGSDCPALNPAYLEAARQRLGDCDVVLGAAEDGGYVLLGCRRICAAVFRDIDWGTGSVRDQTEQRIRSLGWKPGLLPPLLDVDTPADLARWRQAESAVGPIRRRGPR